ncbi:MULTISPECIES: hypothetical protein [Cryobacterium]|uniref:Uncharacterized protein n=1 Tax=Cryobacterium breve TaxID=1259258 RepID=A0ABY2J032_9MICO|nr:MULTISPECIES: hypothetical protein [Cryobacterium]TFC91767.1 hypothetical protein E3T20_12965 [Cryobacterium sp. TmT3-12]TFC98316.1 hypothetical protein E3O65_08185 [Cryobacterium breve]
MLHSPAADDTGSTTAALPTFDALLAGPDDQVGDAGDETPAAPYVWRTRAWLPPTQHQRLIQTL